MEELEQFLAYVINLHELAKAPDNDGHHFDRLAAQVPVLVLLAGALADAVARVQSTRCPHEPHCEHCRNHASVAVHVAMRQVEEIREWIKDKETG